MTFRGVILKHYQQNDLKAIEQFQLLPGDQQFVKTPYDNIMAAKEDGHRYPITVWRNNECVAFFTLHLEDGVKPFSDNPNAVFFRSFSVDARYRKEGIAKQVMSKLLTFIRQQFNNINEIVLTVNTDNPKAFNLYKQQGYNYQGDSTLVGKPVYIMTLKMK